MPPDNQTAAASDPHAPSELSAAPESCGSTPTKPRTYDESAISLAFVPQDSINFFTHRQTLESHPWGKVLLVGLQKSGNTWLHSLLADTLGYPYLFWIDQVEGRGILSTHLPVCKEVLHRHDFIHSVCVIRDLRDVVLSYFDYMNSRGYEREIPFARYPDIETFYFDWFLSRFAPGQRVHTYSAEYAEHGAMIVRYERLLLDTKKELVRLFDRWSQPYDEARMDAAIEANSFERLKSSGKEMGNVSMHASHFNKAQVGRYKQEIPPKVLRDIETRFGPVLERWGYV